MYPAFLLFAIGLIILSQAQFQGYFILIAGIFVGFGYGTFMSSAQAIAIKESPKHRIGLATSTYYIFLDGGIGDRKSTRLNSSHVAISYAVFCLKKKK